MVRLNSRVTRIAQDDKGVTASWTDTKTGATGTTTADYCVCTIPATILAQTDIQVSDAKKAAIKALPYPNYNFFKDGPSVLLGAFAGGPKGYALAGMTPEKRIEAPLTQGAVFHPAEYRREFMNGASVAWSRMPWTLGCCATWTEQTRAEHYQNLVAMDGRIVLAGEHASYYGCWMEGALLSSLDAITHLHQKALAA